MLELPSLYDHQTDQRDRVRAALARHGRVILSAPPGLGKTRMSKWILGAGLNRELSERASGRSLFSVHRRGLVQNAIDSFEEEPALPHGVIMSGRETAYGSRIQVASVDSLLSWFVENDAYQNDITFDLCILDECHSHHSKFARFLQYHDKRREELNLHPAYVIGLSATPKAKGLADVYKEIVPGPATQTLIDEGYLSPFRYFRATEGKLGLLVKRGGEFTKDSVSAAMEGLSGDLVRDWKQYAEGRPTVGFFPRRSHAKDATAELEAAGLRVAYLDGNTPDDERRSIYRSLNEHYIDYLCNVQVVERGTDIPRIGCVQVCVAMASLVRWRQVIGRGSRRHPDKEDVIILDHGGNLKRGLGFFEDDPPWSLDITTKDPGEAGARPTIECPRCCVARGTMILTDRGEVPIQDVQITDRVWDGVDFCSHDGIYCNGIEAVISWSGLILTPDHKVLTNGGWKEAEEAKRNHWRPVSGALSGTPVRTTDDSNPYHTLPGSKPGSRSGLLTLWKEGMATLLQNLSAATSWLRTLHDEVWSEVPRMACAEGQSAEVALSVPTAPCLQDLWWPRDRVSICVGERGGSLDCGTPGLATEQIVDDRQDRQQRPLRAWQSAMGDDTNATAESRFRLAGTLPSEIPIRDVLRDADIQPPPGRAVAEANCRTMVAEVWDIRNVGPRNRYCANGVIVSNCAIYRGGKCRNCGYEPTPRERRAQGLQFDGSELKEVKRTEKKKTVQTAEAMMVSALYKAGRSGRTWRQAVWIFKRLCEKQGTPHHVPKRVTVGEYRYEMIQFGSQDASRRVSALYPFANGEHGGPYLIQEPVKAEPYF